MDTCWISCQVMADMKIFYDNLIIVNLYCNAFWSAVTIIVFFFNQIYWSVIFGYLFYVQIKFSSISCQTVANGNYDCQSWRTNQ